MRPYRTRIAAQHKQIKLVDIGASFGNSTLALIENYDWKQVGALWRNETALIRNKAAFHVTATDLSRNALDYGKRRGYFDKTFVQNVDDEWDAQLAQNIVEADVLCIHMIFCYID